MSKPHYSWPNSEVRFFQEKVVPRLSSLEPLFKNFELLIKEDSQLFSTLFFKYFSNEIIAEFIPAMGSFKFTAKDNHEFGFFWNKNNEVQLIGQAWHRINPLILQGKLLQEINEFCEYIFFLSNPSVFLEDFFFIKQNQSKKGKVDEKIYELKKYKGKTKQPLRFYIQPNGLIRKIVYLDPILRKVSLGYIKFGQTIAGPHSVGKLLMSIKKLGFSLNVEVKFK